MTHTLEELEALCAAAFDCNHELEIDPREISALIERVRKAEGLSSRMLVAQHGLEKLLSTRTKQLEEITRERNDLITANIAWRDKDSRQLPIDYIDVLAKLANVLAAQREALVAERDALRDRVNQLIVELDESGPRKALDEAQTALIERTKERDDAREYAKELRIREHETEDRHIAERDALREALQLFDAAAQTEGDMESALDYAWKKARAALRKETT
ncbi:MAG: hypothetical protein KGL39_05185 [Patescibacteria group bacterium]|nr:hypothetical protein [Patescibacteria group bacterium]